MAIRHEATLTTLAIEDKSNSVAGLRTMDAVTVLTFVGMLALVAGFAMAAPRFGVDSRGLADRPAAWSADAVAWDDGAWYRPAAPSPASSPAPSRAPSRAPSAPGSTDRRWGRRLGQLYAGLVLYGVSMAFMVRARLGVMPWDVLHQGLSRLVHLSLGTVAILVGAVVLLGWVPLRQWPGIGTISNVFVIGVAVDVVLRVLPAPSAIGYRVLFLVAGIGLNAVATAGYIGAGLGPGPRDGLMTGLVRRFGWPVRRVRTGIEVSVVAIGWLLGGNLGPGTLLYALAIGPAVHPLLPRFQVIVGARGSGHRQPPGAALMPDAGAAGHAIMPEVAG
jgi:uncharacterized membrane protein YczE